MANMAASGLLLEREVGLTFHELTGELLELRLVAIQAAALSNESMAASMNGSSAGAFFDGGDSDGSGTAIPGVEDVLAIIARRAWSAQRQSGRARLMIRGPAHVLKTC